MRAAFDTVRMQKGTTIPKDASDEIQLADFIGRWSGCGDPGTDSYLAMLQRIVSDRDRVIEALDRMVRVFRPCDVHEGQFGEFMAKDCLKCVAWARAVDQLERARGK